MMKYIFYFTTSQIGGEGGFDTQTYVGTDRHTNLVGQTVRPTGIETRYLIILVFSWRIIKSYF